MRGMKVTIQHTHTHTHTHTDCQKPPDFYLVTEWFADVPAVAAAVVVAAAAAAWKSEKSFPEASPGAAGN